MKVPQGSMTADGKPVPEGAEPQPDGSVKLPTGSVIPAEGIVLPDGVKLTDVTKPTGEAPKPVASMPDGSKPSTQQGSWTLLTSPVPAGTMDAPSTVDPAGALPSVALPTGEFLVTSELYSLVLHVDVPLQGTLAVATMIMRSAAAD